MGGLDRDTELFADIDAGTLSAATYTATYAYDATNRITGGSLGTLTYGDSNHFHAATASTSGETASYDTNGDMQCRWRAG